MTKLADLPPSTRNKGNTSPIKTKTHIYKRKNRWGVVWSDTPVSGKRRNIIDEKLGSRIISEFNNGYSSLQLEKKYKIDNDTILRFVKSKIPKDRFDKIEKKMINQYKQSNQVGLMNEFEDKYEGSKNKDGLPHGKGTMYYKEDGTHLEGELVDGNFKKQ